jgi:hypothetical protein
MTLSIPVSCPSCPQVLRVPLTAFDLPEGRYLGVEPDELLEHANEHLEAM